MVKKRYVTLEWPLRRYQRVYGKPVQQDAREYFPGYTQKRYSTVVITGAFVTFPFVDVDNGCVLELLRNSPAVPYIVNCFTRLFVRNMLRYL